MDEKRWPRWLPALALGLLTLLIHGSVLRFASIEPEDFVRMFSGSGPGGLPGALALFSSRYFEVFHQNDFYRPLVSAAFHLQWWGFGSRIAAYQATKLGLIWACGLMLAGLGRGLGLRGRFSWFAAALFCVHVRHAQALERLSFIDDYLLTFFSLSALLLYTRARACGKAGWRPLLIGLHYGLALLSKEAALVLPPIFALEWAALSRSGEWPSRADLGAAGAVLSITALYLWLLHTVAPGHYGVSVMGHAIKEQAVALRFYLSGLAPLAAIALLIICDLSWGEPRRALFCVGWVSLAIMPLLGFAGPSLSPDYFIASRAAFLARLTLPCAGFCLLAASSLQALSSKNRPGRIAAAVVGILMIGDHSIHSRAQEASPMRTLAADVLNGAFLKSDYVFRESRFDGALLSLPLIRLRDPSEFEAIRAALRDATPGRGPTLADLFSRDEIYSDTSKYAAVLDALSRKGFPKLESELAAVGPGLAAQLAEASALKDRGVDCFMEGDAGQAEKLLRQSLKLDGDNPETLLSLGALEARDGNHERALSLYDRALALRQEDKSLANAILGARAAALQALKGHEGRLTRS